MRGAQLGEHVREHAGPVLVPHDQHVGRRRRPCQVHHVGHAAGVLERADDADGLAGDGVLRLSGRRTDVVGAVDAGQLHDVIGERARGAGRFGGEHVETRTQALRDDGGGQRRLVHHFGPRGVDEVRAGLHVREQLAVDEAARVLRERQVHADHVGAGHGLGRRRHHGHVVRLGHARRLGGVCGQAPRPHAHRHAERTSAGRHVLADVAEADEPERAAGESTRLRVFLLVPGTGAQVGDVVGDASVEREHEAHRQLGHRDGVLARTVAHVDATP